MGSVMGLCSVIGRRADAAAFIKGSEKYSSVHGRVLFYRLGTSVIVRAEIAGLPRDSGACGGPFFGFHIHEGGKCSGNEKDPFADAGAHLNPHDCMHPYHAGDMPPLLGADGEAVSVFLTNRFTVSEIIGKTVIIHSSPDDFKSQPSGDSGEKIACGIIRKTVR